MPNNIYIHGTTSAVLPTLQYGLMSPIELLNKYMLAPMGGEINKGGLITPQSTCNTCFGLLLPDNETNHYNKDKIINNYAQLPIDLPTKEKIKKAIKECIDRNLSNINEIIVFIARAKQWGLDIQDSVDLTALEKEFRGMQQFYYALLCLTAYAKPNTINATKISRAIKKELISVMFTTNKFHKLVRNLDIDLKGVWRNPNKHDLDKIAKIFSIPAGEYVISDDSEKVSVLEDIYLYTFDKEQAQDVYPTHDEQDVKDAALKVNYLIKKDDEVGSSILYESLKKPELLSLIQPFFLKHILALESRFTLMKNITENKNTKVFTTQEKQLVLDNFPIIFVLEDESLINEQIHNEYRTSATLRLGKEITKIATDNEANKEKMQEWLKQNKVAGVQVTLIDTLHPMIHTHFNLIHANFINDNPVIATMLPTKVHDDYNLAHTNNINEVLDTVCKKSEHLDVSKYTLSELYSQSAQAGEGYSIKEHTILVLKELMLHKKLFLEENPAKMTLNGSKVTTFNLMAAIIALHDIGKGLGPKNKQHENTMPILKAYLEHWGFNRHEIKVAEAIVGHNLIGDLILQSTIAKDKMDDNSINKVAKQLAQKAGECGLDLWTFYKLQCLYYLSDAGSYQFIKQRYMQNTTRQDSQETDFYGNFAYIPKEESFRKLTQAVEKLHKHPAPILSSNNVVGLNKNKNRGLPVEQLVLKKAKL